MRSVVLATVLATAAGVVNTPTSILTCKTQDDCTVYGDSQATCGQITANKCACSSGYSYFVAQAQASTHSYAHCFPDTENQATRGARAATGVITLEYPNGDCTKISQIKQDWDTALHQVLGTNYPIDSTITCGNSLSTGERSGIHISVVYKATVIDLFSSAVSTFDALMENRLSVATKTILGSAVRNWWLTDPTGSTIICEMASNAVSMGYFGSADTCRAAECINRYIIDSAGLCIANTDTNDEMNGGTITGIVIGSVVGVALLIVIIYCICTRSKSDDNAPDKDSSSSSSSSSKSGKTQE